MNDLMRDPAIQHAIAQVTQHPQSAEAWIHLGNLMQARGDKDKAAYCFAQARTLSRAQPPTPPAPAPPPANTPANQGALFDRLKQTASQAAQKAQEVDWANKARQAAQATATAATQAQQFVAENQESFRQAGQTAVNTTAQVGRAATTISSATASTAVKAGKVMTTFQIALIIIAGSFALCALSGVAYVIFAVIRK